MKIWLSDLRRLRSPSDNAVSALATAGSPDAPSSRTTASIAGKPLAVANLAMVARREDSSAVAGEIAPENSVSKSKNAARIVLRRAPLCPAGHLPLKGGDWPSCLLSPISHLAGWRNQ